MGVNNYAMFRKREYVRFKVGDEATKRLTDLKRVKKFFMGKIEEFTPVKNGKTFPISDTYGTLVTATVIGKSKRYFAFIGDNDKTFYSDVLS